ncbi:MAG: HAD-IC family P-type ATPase, partial [Flavobacteriaceae bacterium]
VKHRLLTLDVPIALGILVLFITSLYNTLLLDTLGYFDSLTGFVFFLLLGKYIQTITYTKFSFERDYTSFFPLAIQKKTSPNSYTYSLLEDIKKGDELYLKPMEIIPVDGYLLSNAVDINYSFVTGESDPVRVKKGESVYAGGRIEDQACALVAAQEVIQSRLIQLWNQDSFRKNDPQGLHQISNRISSYFTPAILLIALIVGTVWFFIDPLRVFETTTAVLIVACPCALALSAPFVLSNMLRYFGRHKMYFKNTSSIERLAEVNHLVFDKTGTLTDQESSQIKFIGPQLNTQEKGWIRSLAHYSNHPLSVQVDHFLKPTPHQKVLRFQTELGQGISATVQGNKIRMGNPGWINQVPTLNGERNSWVAVDINSVYRGAFQIKQPLRSGLKKMFSKLDQYSLSMVSGDKKENKKAFQSLFDSNQLFFEQDPFQKINYIKSLQKEGKKVAMIGDGLNDAGALKQSDFGLAVALNSHTFTPACDAIVSGVQIPKLHEMLWAAKKSLQLIKLSFLLSLMYNLVGLYFAITGQLSPIIAAILMPLSSISVVLFASATTAILNKKLEKKLKE